MSNIRKVREESTDREPTPPSMGHPRDSAPGQLSHMPPPTNLPSREGNPPPADLPIYPPTGLTPIPPIMTRLGDFWPDKR